MITSKKGLDLIMSFEGCHLTCYADSKNVPTIGYGHTGDLKRSDVGTLTITQQQAEEFLKSDLSSAERKVNKYYDRYKWTQDEFDALVSFAFNIGNIDQLTDNGTRSRSVISKKFLEYTKCGNKVLPGLVKRRQAEHALFTLSSKGENMNVVEFSLKADGEKNVSPHFKVKEFKCKDGSDKILVDVEFVQNKLESIRSFFNKPVNINSAYRSPSYNQKVGGATNSYHMKGMAFDIVIKDVTPAEIAKAAYALGVNGVIQYNTFVHVDDRPNKYFALNNNGKVTKVAKF